MIFAKAQELAKTGESFVSVTLLAVTGSAPQIPGAKCVVSERGLEAGTVGGGKLEAAAIEEAQKILRERKQVAPQILKWNLQKDIGMTCGGVAELLFEHFSVKCWPIAIFGAGHVSQALTRALAKLQCQVTVVDDRQQWLDKLDNVNVFKTSDAKEAVSYFNEDTFFISMTKGHATDVPFLAEIYRQFPNAPYVGAIGSKTKSIVVKNDLRKLDVSQDFIERLHIPIGLSLGNNTPEEIAISIVAQLLQIRDSY